MPTYKVTRRTVIVHENVVEADNGQQAMWKAMHELRGGRYDAMYVEGERRYSFEEWDDVVEAA